MLSIVELQSSLQKLTNRKITFTEIGIALGSSRANISNRVKRNSVLKFDEVKRIEEYFNVNIETEKLTEKLTSDSDIINIPYWSELPEELKNPDFTCVTAERKVIENHWYLEPENLCIVPMVGNKMQNYWYPMSDGDILIVNTKQNYIMGNGVYFATSRNNTRFWVREMQVLVNDDIEFKGFAPSGETTKTLSKQELADVGFKIIGKVIKNVSFKL